MVLLVFLAAVGTLLPLAGGPPLGDHECLHAQVSRQMLQSGNWLVSRYGQAVYGNKPPLKSWLTAATARLLEPPSDTPVTPFSARLPSAVAGFLTVLILWRLSVSMFGAGVGLTTGLVAASTFATLFYANNGMMEMTVAATAAWAFAEFWWAIHAATRGRRRLHFALFYVALGLGVLTKGPVPLALVGMPLAVWWFVHRPVRLALAGAWDRRFAAATVGQQFVRAFTRTWLLPGVLIFLASFGWWAVAAYLKQPDIIWIWHAQFIGHATGQMLHSSPKAHLYYLPYAFALTVPWLLSVPEATVSPFLTRYRRYRRPLLYACCWWLVGLLVLSLVVASKRPHYLLSSVGGAVLLLGVVLHRLFGPVPQPSRKLLTAICVGVPTCLAIGLLAAWIWVHYNAPAASASVAVVAFLTVVGFTASAVAYLRGRRALSFGLIPTTAVAVFVSGWLWIGPYLGLDAQARDVLAAIEAADIDPGAEIYWGDRRPDARVVFYGQRDIRYIMTPMEVEAELEGRPRDRQALELRVADRIIHLLAGDKLVYIVMRAGNWGRLSNVLEVEGRVLDVVDGRQSEPDSSLVIVTNKPTG